MNDTAFFQFSTEEDLSFVLEFSGLVLTGRAFEVKIKDRASDTTRATLTNGSGITLSSAVVLEAAFARTGMTSWPRGEYTADVVDVTAGARSRIMAVRFILDVPGRLVQGVRDRKAFINWSPNQAVVTATGAIGPSGPQGLQGIQGAKGDKGDTGNTGSTGPANSLAIGTVTNGAPGSAAATITGTAPNQTLGLTLPQGLPGNGGNTSEILAAAGITEQPNLVFDPVRSEYFARGTGNYLSILALVTALGGVSSFSRASTATYFDSDGLLKTAAAGVPRIEYDPVTRACRGLLIENQARTNLALRSDNLSTGWTLGPNSSLQGTTVSPRGQSDASVIRFATVGNAYATQIVAMAANTTYTFSCWLKRLSGATAGGLVCAADYTNGSGSARVASGDAASLTNEWRRYEVTFTNVVAGSYGLYPIADVGGTAPNDVAVFGMQFEEGSKASSYIPTTASAVTRAADYLELAGQVWIQGAGQSALVEFDIQRPRGDSTVSYPFLTSNATGDSYFTVREGAIISGADFFVGASGVVQVASGAYSVANNTAVRVAFGADSSGWGYAKSNVLTYSGGAISVPSGVDRLKIGVDLFMGHIRRVVVWPQRLTNAKVQAASNIAWPSTIVSPPAIADGDKGDISVTGGGTIWMVDPNAVDNTKLRDSTALSVIGRSTNTTGDPADIAAGTDGYVLRRAGSTLGFGQIFAAGIADSAFEEKVPQTKYKATITATEAGTFAGLDARFVIQRDYLTSTPLSPEIFEYSTLISSDGESGSPLDGFKVLNAKILVGQTGSGSLFGENPVMTLEAGFPATSDAFVSEINVNNFARHYDGFSSSPYTAVRHVTGAGTYRMACVDLISPPTQQFTFGYTATGDSIKEAVIRDDSEAMATVRTTGSHQCVIDAGLSSLSLGGVLLPNAVPAIMQLQPSSSTYVSLLQLNSANRLEVGTGAMAYIQANNSILPGVDNTYVFGNPDHRWSVIYAVNGAIQTSDPRLKTQIQDVEGGLSLVKAIMPKSYLWLEGGKTFEEIEEPGLVQAVEEVEIDVVEEIDGKFYKVKKADQRPIMDTVPLHDADGVQIVEKVRTFEADETGNLRQVVIDKALTTSKPRMVPGLVKKKVETSVPGKRRHWGFMASGPGGVKPAIDAMNADREKDGIEPLDFGGYVLDGGIEMLRPDQLLPILWSAVQELARKVEYLEDQR